MKKLYEQEDTSKLHTQSYTLCAKVTTYSLYIDNVEHPPSLE